MKFEITAEYHDTPFLPSFWGILNREPLMFRKDLSLKERLKVFFKTHPEAQHQDSLTFEKLFEQINYTSTWFMGGSEVKSSLIACALQQSDKGYTLAQNQFLQKSDASIIMGNLKPPNCLHRIDIRPLPLTHQQKILLSLIGTQQLLSSPYFDCQSVAIVDEVSIHSIYKTG